MADLSKLAPSLRRHPDGYYRPAQDDTRNVAYPSGAHDFCFDVEEESFWFAHRNRVIASTVRALPPAGGPVFDVGAGNGFVTAGLRAAGFDAIAIEPNAAGARHAVERGVPVVICASLESAQLADGSAGAIGLFDVIEHIHDDVAFLASMRRYLTPDGRLYITVPAWPWLWSSDDEEAGHVRRYSPKTLRTAIEAAGFEVEYDSFFFSILPLPILVFRTLASCLRRDRRRTPRASEHRAGGATVRRIVESVLALETLLMRRGRRIPFGASCIAVARVHRADQRSHRTF